MGTFIYFAFDEGWVDGRQRLVRDVLARVGQHASELLGMEANTFVTVDQWSKPLFANDPLFVGGSAVAKDWIRIKLPPDVNEGRLTQAMYHEMHHLARGHYYYQCEKATLVEDIVAEGLATVFSLEQVSNPIPPFAQYDAALMPGWFEELRPHALEVGYDPQDWFYENARYPHFGYKLGRYIADQVTERHPEQTMVTLVRTPVREVLELAGVNLEARLLKKASKN
jgi:uncharacterized protein YjaZ